jgi:hypothetical protein
MENGREWDEVKMTNEQFRKETDEMLANIAHRKTQIELMLGEQYQDYFNDEKHAL